MAATSDRTPHNNSSNNIRPLVFRGETTDSTEQELEPDPPSDEAAEAGVLGCILENAVEVIPQVRGIVSAKDFSRNKHRIIYQTALDMFDAGDPVDVSTVPIEIQRRGKAEEVEGIAYVMSLPNLIVATHDAAYFARTVKDASVARHAIDVAGKLGGLGYSNPGAAAILAEFDQLHEQMRTQVGALAPGRFGIRSDTELEQMRPVRGIVGTWVRDQDIVAMYGVSGNFKSFLAIGLGECCATGMDWYGMPVEQRTVLYVAAEAPNTIGERVTAWKQQHGMAGQHTEFYVSTLPVDLTSREDMNALIAEVREVLPDAPGLVIIDTWACSVPGDEKDATTVNAAYRGMRMLRDAFGAAVIYVDHEGKDRERGQNGSQRKKDNADVQIHVESIDGSPGMITVKAVKMKSDETPSPLTLATKKVTWFDPREQTVRGSLVLINASKAQAQAASAEARSTRLPRRQRQALDVLTDQSSSRAPYGEWWRTVHTIYPDFPKSSFDDARKNLEKSRLIELVDGEYVSLVQSKNRTSTAALHRTSTVSTVPYIRDCTTVPSGPVGADAGGTPPSEEGEEITPVNIPPYHRHDPKTLSIRRDGISICDGCHPRHGKSQPPQAAT